MLAVTEQVAKDLEEVMPGMVIHQVPVTAPLAVVAAALVVQVQHQHRVAALPEMVGLAWHRISAVPLWSMPEEAAAERVIFTVVRMQAPVARAAVVPGAPRVQPAMVSTVLAVVVVVQVPTEKAGMVAMAS
jgi:hypothetical protein